jgi:CDP-diacylglycerol--serine O-phosphatidyltransferase
MRLYTKDYVTAGNFLCGFGSALFAMKGDLVMAGLMMPAAMFFDAMDGLVARLTHRHNRFGGEFDNVADHMSYGVAPAFLLFAAYQGVFQDELQLQAPLAVGLAFLVGAIPLFFASLRFARFNTYHYDVPGYWLGVPRPATAFALAALVNSHVFAHSLHARLACIGLVLLFGLLNASTFPYLNHHHVGRNPSIIWFYFGFFAVSTGLSILLGPILGLVPNEYVGDSMLFCMSLYAFFGWMEVPASARRHARRAVMAGEASDALAAGEPPPPPEPAPEPPPAAPGGTAARVVAGLSYLLGPVSGVLVLRSRHAADPFVRFHAWQAIFAVIAVGVFYGGVAIFHGMAADSLPGTSLLGMVGWPAGAFFLAIWGWLIVSAFRGRKAHGPFIGPQADKQLM